MAEEEYYKRTNDALEEIKSELQDGVIKDIEIPPLVNMKTGKTTGHAVEMQVSTKYDYNETLLTEWKDKPKADAWNIRVRNNRLFLRFFIHYKED